MGKTKVQKIGFLVGIVAMLVIGFMPTPEGLSLVGQAGAGRHRTDGGLLDH